MSLQTHSTWLAKDIAVEIFRDSRSSHRISDGSGICQNGVQGNSEGPPLRNPSQVATYPLS